MGVTIVNSGVRQEKGITYSEITDSSADWGDVTDGAYFYDIATDLPYYKSSGGLILSLFSEANNLYTSDGTLTGDRTIDQGSHTLTFNGNSIGHITSSFNGRTAFKSTVFNIKVKTVISTKLCIYSCLIICRVILKRHPN